MRQKEEGNGLQEVRGEKGMKVKAGQAAVTQRTKELHPARLGPWKFAAVAYNDCNRAALNSGRVFSVTSVSQRRLSDAIASSDSKSLLVFHTLCPAFPAAASISSHRLV